MMRIHVEGRSMRCQVSKVEATAVRHDDLLAHVARPRPVPWGFVISKRAKTSRPSGTPGPLSSTDTRTVSGVSMAARTLT